MSVQLFKGNLSGTFVPSSVLTLAAEKGTFDFELVTSGGPTSVEWYLAFGSAPSDCTFREVDESSVAGAISMPKAVRTFKESGGAALADGTHKLSVQFQLRHAFVRLYLRVAAGAARATVTAPFGTIAT